MKEKNAISNWGERFPMKKTNDNSAGEKLDEQLSINTVELLRENIGYNEFTSFFESFLGKKNKNVEKKIATIVSISTFFFWLCKVISFSYLSGINCYYGISNKYICINDNNLEYQIFQYISGVLIIGFLTIIFMNIWLEHTEIKKKIAKTIGLTLLEISVVYVGLEVYTYGLHPMKIINEMLNYTKFEIISLIIMLIFMWFAVHYFGIISLILYGIRKNKIDKNVKKQENNEYKKIRKPLLKNNIEVMIIFSVSLVFFAWIYGMLNEMFRTEYNIIEYSSFDEENTDEKYIFQNDDKRYVAYVVISDMGDYFLCKRITNKYDIKCNGQSFIKKEGTETIKIRKHLNKN